MLRALLVLALLWAAQGMAETESPAVIEATSEPTIEATIGAVVAELAPESTIAVRAAHGVVTLEGRLTDPDLADQIVTTVGAMDGVLAVRDQLELDLSVTAQVNPVARRLHDLGAGFVGYTPLLAIAAVVFVLFWVVASWLGGPRAIYRRFSASQPLQELARSTVRLIIIVFGAVVALDILNATAIAGGILGAAGVAGIAVGFAFRDLIENYIASLMLSIRQPFRPDDHVIIDGREGIVSRLTTRSTILVTFDGNTLRLPNSLVFKSVITNFSAQPERRFDFKVGVGYDVDLTLAQRLGLETIGSIDGVLEHPGPTVRVQELGDSTVTLAFFAWINQATHSLGAVRSQTLAAVKQVFESHAIDMPEPTYNVRMAQVTRIPERHMESTTPASAEVADQYAAESDQSEFIQAQARSERERTADNMIDGQTATE